MSQAFQGEASSGDSSRSSSPASEDIDMEGAPSLSKAHSSQHQLQAPFSPVSPQQNGGLPSGALNGGGVSTAGQRVSKQVNRNAQAGNRKRPGHSKHDPSSHMRDGEGSGYSRGLMDPAQGSAYERLLDLNYPRDYGDPVLRYDAALAHSGGISGLQSTTNVSQASSS